MLSVESLFTQSRFPSGLDLLPIILYIPIGLLLVLVRVFILIHTVIISCLLPRCYFRACVLRTMYGVLGLQVLVVEDPKTVKNAKILVSNHVSPLDHCVIDQVRPNIQPDYWDMHSVWKWIFGYKDMGVSKGHDVFEENIKKHCAESDIPLLFHPERTTTSGRVGLLKFSTFPFELGQPVQPISIRVSRYIFHISLTTIHSDWWSDLFWCLFVPFTVYQLRFLPVEEKQDGEDAEDFAKRVQKRIAKPLKLWRTDFTYTEKAEFVKRLKPPRKIIQNSVASNNPSEKTVNKQELDPEFLKMIKQVKGVLPHIPDSAIEKDLRTTEDIDITITNILEGRVTCEDESEEKSTESVILPSNHKYAAKSFPRSANDRQLSYQDRKKNMLEAARYRYKQKHGML